MPSVFAVAPEREVPCLSEAEVPVLLADDEVIEQPDIQNIRRGAEPRRESSVVRAWRRIAARVVVNHDQPGRSRRQACGNEDIRHRDICARARAAGEHMPGEEPMLGHRRPFPPPPFHKARQVSCPRQTQWHDFGQGNYERVRGYRGTQGSRILRGRRGHERASIRVERVGSCSG